jgi:hypothetical protein
MIIPNVAIALLQKHPSGNDAPVILRYRLARHSFWHYVQSFVMLSLPLGFLRIQQVYSFFYKVNKWTFNFL